MTPQDVRREVGTLANERLRSAIHTSGSRIEEIAEAVGCDRKTVERWIDGHVPYKRNQHALAHLLGEDVAYLWPPATADLSQELGMAELMAIWPVRSLVPTSTWVTLFQGAEREIDMLVYAGFWLSEDPGVREVLRTKSRAGVRVRLLIGDPESNAVAQREVEEGIGGAIAAKIRNTIHNYRDVVAAPSTSTRLHSTTLYNSIYRADDEMLINSHVYGLPGHMTPLVRLRKVPGAQLFRGYAESFDRVWDLGVELASATAAR